MNVNIYDENYVASRRSSFSDLVDKHSLFVLSKPRDYTYHSGDNSSTLDYIICSTSLVGNCLNNYVHPPHPLNLSDHLPISASFDFDLCPSTSSRDPVTRVNWSKGMAEGLLQLYEDALTLIVEPLLKINTQSCSELNDEIVFVCNAMVDCANELLPMSAPQKHTKTWVHNDQLRALCNDSKKNGISKDSLQLAPYMTL